MRVSRCFAVITVVGLLSFALPSPAAAQRATDANGSVLVLPATGPAVAPHKYKKPVAGVWKVLAWIGVGYAVAVVVAVHSKR